VREIAGAYLPPLVDGSPALRSEALVVGALPEWLAADNSFVTQMQLTKESFHSTHGEGEIDAEKEGEGAVGEAHGGVAPPLMTQSVETACAAPKRFAVGTKVRCLVGSPPEWQAGHVVAHDYREESFPPNVFAAYQVKILDGTLIFAPVDVVTSTSASARHER